VVTQPLNYFSVWLKSLNRFSVYQINLFPTAAQGTGLVFTLLYGWLADGLNKRWQILVVPAVRNECAHSMPKPMLMTSTRCSTLLA
jgi:ACS family pantothenate transporter-like MFS transporter